MTWRSRLAPPRLRSSSVRRGAGARSQSDPALSVALLPPLPGPRHPAARLVTPPLPLQEPQPGPELLVESP